jgi:hypothetical protein
VEFDVLSISLSLAASIFNQQPVKVDWPMLSAEFAAIDLLALETP